MKHKVYQLDHHQLMDEPNDEEPCVAFFFPHLSAQRDFLAWYLENGGEEAFLKFRGPVYETVEDLPDGEQDPE